MGAIPLFSTVLSYKGTSDLSIRNTVSYTAHLSYELDLSD